MFYFSMFWETSGMQILIKGLATRKACSSYFILTNILSYVFRKGNQKMQQKFDGFLSFKSKYIEIRGL